MFDLDKHFAVHAAALRLSAQRSELIARNLANADVVMYSISSLNEGKYRVMADSMAAAFRGEPMRQTPIAPKTDEGIPSTELIAMQNPPLAGQNATPPSLMKQNPASLADIGDEVARAMAPLVLKDEVIIRKHQNWLEVEIKNDVLFPSGSATLTPNATSIVQRLSSVLAGLPNPIFVEGHTDNVPIASTVFPSNWELSAARASAVIRLLASGGVSPTQMTALGLGAYRPTQSKESVESRAANRRVLLAILQPERTGQSLYSQSRDPSLELPKAPPPKR
jgi:chemotaxis protein MotB